MSADFNILKGLVLDWAEEKGILKHGDPKTQLLKTVSEIGELADNIAKGDHAAAEDDAGDVLVTLIILSEMVGLDLLKCLESAYLVISRRKGKMINGTFVKDEL